jgi:hypothetical protein
MAGRMILLFWVGGFQGWGRSSAGRAPALQAGGRRFDPDRLHHPRLLRKRGEARLPSHGGNRLLANDESRSPEPSMARDESTSVEATLVCIAECPESGLIICLGQAPGLCGHAVCAARLGGIVLCYCESGSGASLDACDSRSVCGWIEGPVVRPNCLTGNCCCPARMRCIRVRRAAPQRPAARVQRRVNDLV